MVKTFTRQITFTLTVEGENLPDELPDTVMEAVVAELNMTADTNDKFVDRITDTLRQDVVGYSFSI